VEAIVIEANYYAEQLLIGLGDIFKSKFLLQAWKIEADRIYGVYEVFMLMGMLACVLSASRTTTPN
jgi:hypothetical protein